MDKEPKIKLGDKETPEFWMRFESLLDRKKTADESVGHHGMMAREAFEEAKQGLIAEGYFKSEEEVDEAIKKDLDKRKKYRDK